MATQMQTVTVPELKRAIEGRDAKALAGFYAENAVVRIIDRDNLARRLEILMCRRVHSGFSPRARCNR